MSKLPRLTLLPFLLWALLVGLMIAGVFYASKTFAALDYRAEGGNGQVAGLRLSEAPCNEKVLVHLKPEFHARFKAAVLTWAGRDWHACWTKIEIIDQNGREQAMVWSVDEEGAPFNPPYGIPLRLFREDAI